MKENLLEDVQKCMVDPVSNILQNFSLEKSEEYYNNWVFKWGCGDFRWNPAVKLEEERIEYDGLVDLPTKSAEAHNLCINLKSKEYNKGVEWHVDDQFILVVWYRLKTFDEWLHDGLAVALTQAYNCPEEGAKMIIERELWKWVYRDVYVHLFVEWKIDADTLKRLWQNESWRPVCKWRNLETDIEACMTALYDMEENNSETGQKSPEEEDKKSGTTVFKFKI